MFADGKAFLERLASVSDIIVQQDKSGIPDTAVAAIFASGEIYIPLEDLIDIAKELERLGKEKDNLSQEIDRVNQKLSNEAFVGKAPQKVIDAEKEKLDKYLEMFTRIESRMILLQQSGSRVGQEDK
jgi:valyl-tRNA synthetase